jgi:hypothetical protein
MLYKRRLTSGRKLEIILKQNELGVYRIGYRHVNCEVTQYGN